MKISPIDIEAFERDKKEWDPYYIVSVLSDLISRQRGYPVEIVLTPKNPETEKSEDVS